MSSLPSRTFDLPPPADRRLASLAVTLLVHAALVVGWQIARTAPPLQNDDDRFVVQWLRLPAPAPRIEAAPVVPPARPTPAVAGRRSAPAVSQAPRQVTAAEPLGQTEPSAPLPAFDAPPATSAGAIMEAARRSVGSIDRALRKDKLPTIVLPPDSPQLRMREGMELAHALAPPKLWQAPKVEELVNNTGDGARRTRVITANGTYCLTERSPVTNVEMIEMHGKQRFTSCPKHETPAKKQVWRMARD